MNYRFETKIDKQRWFKDTSTIPTSWLSEELRQAIFKISKAMPSVAYVTHAASDYSFIMVVIGNELYVHTGNHNLEEALSDEMAILGDTSIQLEEP